ncbi:MAG: hypothetical protein IJL24_09615 [Treponema sp.]|nr:hypothetical protein [Treponema sp.]
MVEFCPMKVLKYIKNAAPVLALVMAAFFAGCSNSSGGATPTDGVPANPILTPGYYMTSAMVATQTAAASEGTITVNPTTKTLTITGAAGKAIYMVRSNIRDSALQKDNLRFIDAPTQNSVSASVIQAAIERKEKDPRALIEDLALKNISKIGISKSLAPAVQAAKTYDPDDENNNTEVFLEFQDLNSEKLEPRTYVILASETEYNLWVNANDESYNKDKDTFKTKAIAAGEKFIQGYKLVKHIYGEPSSKLYKGNASTGSLGEQGNMSDLSKCGDKINIMFFSMLNGPKIKNLNGFVSHNDNYYDPTNLFSNNGRFLYIDSSLVLNDLGTLYSTMLHEFSHAISYNQKTLINKVSWTYWYGEMLAMLCEDMMQEYLGILDGNVNPQDSAQTATALSASPKGRLSLANNLGGMWGLTGQEAEVYAEAFELGAWLARRFGGVKLIKELATNAYVDWDSILNAVNKVNSTNHTIQSLLTLLAEDMLEQKTDSGLNQAAAKYDGDATLTYDNYDNNGSKYLYPLTAIDLWNSNQFYDWYDTNLASKNLVQNQTRPSSGVPSGNIYKNKSENVFIGPCLLKRNAVANIGPYGRISSKLTDSAEDTVTLTFSCNATTFGDTMTIFVK